MNKPIWIVTLVKTPTRNPYGENFFPRKYYYKNDAKLLVKEVELLGGKAIMEKLEKSRNSS